MREISRQVKYLDERGIKTSKVTNLDEGDI